MANFSTTTTGLETLAAPHEKERATTHPQPYFFVNLRLLPHQTDEALQARMYHANNLTEIFPDGKNCRVERRASQAKNDRCVLSEHYEIGCVADRALLWHDYERGLLAYVGIFSSGASRTQPLTPLDLRMTMGAFMNGALTPRHVPLGKRQKSLEQDILWRAR
jgi:hypothetical protein